MIDQPTPRGFKLARLLLSAVVAIPLFATWGFLMSGRLSVEEVISASMEPTLKIGDRVVVRRWTDEGVNAGDIVVVKPRVEGEAALVKRLVAIPGDEVSMYDGSFFVNGEPLPARAGYFPHLQVIPLRRMGDDEYYLLGDNYGKSEDSTSFGPVSRSDIVGRVWFRYAPWSDRGAVE